MSVDDILNAATFSTETVKLCLRPDLQKRREELRTEIVTLSAAKEAEAKSNDRLGAKKAEESEDRIAPVREELERVTEEMHKATLFFDFEGISTTEYNQLVYKSGKPRQNNEADRLAGFNQAAFLNMAIRRCCVRVRTSEEDEGTKFTDERWDKLISVISDAQYDKLALAAHNVNRREVPVPSVGRN